MPPEIFIIHPLSSLLQELVKQANKKALFVTVCHQSYVGGNAMLQEGVLNEGLLYPLRTLQRGEMYWAEISLGRGFCPSRTERFP